MTSREASHSRPKAMWEANGSHAALYVADETIDMHAMTGYRKYLTRQQRKGCMPRYCSRDHTLRVPRQTSARATRTPHHRESSRLAPVPAPDARIMKHCIETFNPSTDNGVCQLPVQLPVQMLSYKCTWGSAEDLICCDDVGEIKLYFGTALYTVTELLEPMQGVDAQGWQGDWGSFEVCSELSVGLDDYGRQEVSLSPAETFAAIYYR